LELFEFKKRQKCKNNISNVAASMLQFRVVYISSELFEDSSSELLFY